MPNILSSPPLLELLRGSTDALRLRPLAAEIVDDAAQHGLTPVVDQCLAAVGVDVSADLRARLQDERLAIAAAGMRTKALLLRAVDAMAPAGVVPVILKGYGFALRYYPEPLMRPAADVDVLVSPDQLSGVERALASLGLARHDDPADGMAIYHHHIAFAGAAGLVEVHFRPTSGLGTERTATLDVRWTPGTIEGRVVHFLQPEDELVYMAIHAAQHLFLRLNWLYDLKLLVEKTPVDWARVVSIARASGMKTAVYTSLFALHAAFRTPIPSTVDALRPPPWQRALIHRIFTERQIVSGYVARHRNPRFIVRALIAEGPARIARHLVDGAAREIFHR